MLNAVLQTAAGFFVPGYTTYRYSAGDLKKDDLTFSVVALDLLSLIPTAANGCRSLRFFSRISGLSGLFRNAQWTKGLVTEIAPLLEWTGRTELFIGRFRKLPLLIIGADYLITKLRGNNESAERERLTEFLVGAVLFGAGQFHRSAASVGIVKGLCRAPLDPAPVTPHIDRAFGLTGAPFPKNLPHLENPFDLDFRQGRSDRVKLGRKAIRNLFRAALVARSHPGNKDAAIAACKADVGRQTFRLSESRVTSEGLDNLSLVPEDTVVLFVGSHTSTWWDFTAPYLLGQNADGSFNRLITASIVADSWNFRINPFAVITGLGKLAEQEAQAGFIRRTLRKTGLNRIAHQLWEYGFHILDAIRHPIEALRAGFSLDPALLKSYVEGTGRLRALTRARIAGGRLSGLEYPHGGRTKALLDDQGNDIVQRVLSAITYKHGGKIDLRWQFIRGGFLVHDLREIARLSGKRICMVPIHRSGHPITPQQFSDPRRMFFDELTTLGQETHIRIGRPRLLDTAAADQGMMDAVQQAMIDASRIREELLELVPRFYTSPEEREYLAQTLRTAMDRNDHRPFILFERILAIDPRGPQREIREGFLARFARTVEGEWDGFVLEVNHILGTG